MNYSVWSSVIFILIHCGEFNTFLFVVNSVAFQTIQYAVDVYKNKAAILQSDNLMLSISKSCLDHSLCTSVCMTEK